MKETKWTSGPWRQSGTWIEVQSSDHLGHHIAVGNVIQLKEWQANARLISKAPEMVEALKDLMRCYVGERNSSNVVGESGIVADKVRALLSEIENGGEK